MTLRRFWLLYLLLAGVIGAGVLVGTGPDAWPADVAPVSAVQITGGDEAYKADVELIDGKYRLNTTGLVQIDQLFGQDPQATSYFYIGTAEDASGVGNAGDTVRVQIPGAVTPLYLVYPAVDVTTTVTAGMVASSNPERALAVQICSDLNADSNFQAAMWHCIVIKDHSGVFINSKLFNEWGERTAWTVTATGTTVVNKSFGDIARRGYPAELSRSPNDPRKGVLAIAGSVTTLPGGLGKLYFEYFKNGSSSDLRVNGSVTPVVFTIPTSATETVFINQVRCFGGGSGIKFGQFLSKNVPLTNGILVAFKSDDQPLTLEPIRTTEAFKNLFSFQGASNFKLDVQSGADQFIAVFQPIVAFPLKKQGTYTVDDYAKISIRDDLSSGLSQLQCLAAGFRQEE